METVFSVKVVTPVVESIGQIICRVYRNICYILQSVLIDKTMLPQHFRSITQHVFCRTCD